MQQSIAGAFYKNFLGHAPEWYKLTIIAFLVINPILFSINPFISGWVLVLEFIFTLAMALKCYPLQPGGLLVIEALFLGMTSIDHVEKEIASQLEVILLLVFMVAGIYFMKNLLLFLFTKIIVRLQSKTLTSVAFAFTAAFLSAFLDALTVIAVIIAVATGFYSVYHRVASGKDFNYEHDHSHDESIAQVNRKDLDAFRAYLRSLLMHASVGTALGGVATMVGEPQNLIIADRAGFDFIEFAIRVAPVSIPVLFFGLLTTVIVEKFKIFSYGSPLPSTVRKILEDFDRYSDEKRTRQETVSLFAQGFIAIWLVIGLALHLAAVGLIGLSIIVLATSATGIIEEHKIGKAFEEALPFTSLLCVFFAVVTVIIDLKLFSPVIEWVLTFEGEKQLALFFIANGVLSMISDNVFVGTIYINEVTTALQNGIISREQYNLLAIAINTGTNLPSVATPNGQAAFLFLLTSALAPLLRLSYMRMVVMAFPYTIVLSIVGLFATYALLPEATIKLEKAGYIQKHEVPKKNTTELKGH